MPPTKQAKKTLVNISEKLKHVIFKTHLLLKVKLNMLDISTSCCPTILQTDAMDSDKMHGK